MDRLVQDDHLIMLVPNCKRGSLTLAALSPTTALIYGKARLESLNPARIARLQFVNRVACRRQSSSHDNPMRQGSRNMVINNVGCHLVAVPEVSEELRLQMEYFARSKPSPQSLSTSGISSRRLYTKRHASWPS